MIYLLLNIYCTYGTKNKQEVLETLRELIMSNPDMAEEYSWSRPVYRYKGKYIAYLLYSKEHMTLGLHYGAHLEDSMGIIEGTGDNMRHIKIKNFNKSNLDYYKDLIKQSISIINKQP